MGRRWCAASPGSRAVRSGSSPTTASDRKSTRLNSSHSQISYAVFCLKKKKKQIEPVCRQTIMNKSRIPIHNLNFDKDVLNRDVIDETNVLRPTVSCLAGYMHTQ